MAKKIETKTEPVNGKKDNDVQIHKAISIIYKGGKKYSVVSVDFALESENVKVLEDDLDIYESHHSFKTNVVKLGLFDEGVDKSE